MLQIVLIVFFVLLMINMPKNNKEEKEAAHLIIQKYKISVNEYKNIFKQIKVIEEALQIEDSFSKKRAKIIRNSLLGFLVAFLIGMSSLFFIYQEKILFVLFITSLILFFILMVYLCYNSYQLNIKDRVNAWKKILTKVDSTIDVQQLETKEWQKVLLTLVSAKEN